jgi:conserved oligomeric Golgi complex subunit 2
MPKPNELFSLPAGPPDLCFDKNEFMKVTKRSTETELAKKFHQELSSSTPQKTFSADEFLQEHRSAATLEIMRDDLGLYLKLLRSAMIELINEDYGDFVNLSANLIGLDEHINGLQSPLVQLRDEIEAVKRSLVENMAEITECLDQKKALRRCRKSLKSLATAKESLVKLENLLATMDGGEMRPTVLERAALELTQLQFNMKFCDEFLEPQHRDQAAHCQRQLLDKLQRYFFRTLRAKELDNLERCLRIYCTLDECKAAEAIFRKDCVAVHMNRVITESNLQNTPQGLTGVYNQILDFVSLNMKELLSLTKPNGRVRGFDFIVNSFWLDVEQKLAINLTSIFAPGNPEAFYAKYKCTLEFLERVEMLIEDRRLVASFRQTAQYKHFQSRWNLPVYFQIRFQEIGAALEQQIAQAVLVQAANELKVLPFHVGLASISRCWADGVYLPQLFHRFFKLTLQLLARLVNWTDGVLAHPPGDAGVSASNLHMLLYLDVVRLVGRLPLIFQVVVEKIPAYANGQLPAIEKCLDDSRDQFAERLGRLEASIIDDVVVGCGAPIRQVNDIPRLFRKTNREVPSKCCGYVEQILAPVRRFHSDHRSAIGPERSDAFLKSIFSRLTVQ